MRGQTFEEIKMMQEKQLKMELASLRKLCGSDNLRTLCQTMTSQMK
jgi:hypothetical protein